MLQVINLQPLIRTRAYISQGHTQTIGITTTSGDQHLSYAAIRVNLIYASRMSKWLPTRDMMQNQYFKTSVKRDEIFDEI